MSISNTFGVSAVDGRNGNWMQTLNGREFYPIDPRVEEIYLDDIAGALSKCCRYGGHCKKFYSVAEHSVYVSRLCSPQNALTALLHDASEAYLVDIPRPIKPFLSNYYDLEDTLMCVIAKRFDLIYPFPDEIKYYDNAVLMHEMNQIMAKPPRDWGLGNIQCPMIKIECWEPREAERQFLKRYDELAWRS